MTLDRQTGKWASTKAQVDSPRIPERRTVVRHRGVGPGPCDGQVRGRGRVRTVSFRTLISGGRSMTVMEDHWNRTNMDGEKLR